MGEVTENLKLQMPYDTEYYNINVFNGNARILDDEVMKKSRYEFLIAAPNTPDIYKKRADVCCESESSMLADIRYAVSRLADGDTLRFCPGDYGFFADNGDGIVIDKKIRVTGCGISTTTITQKGYENDPSRCSAIFTVRSEHAVIENMMLADSISAENEFAMINIAADSVELRDLFFVQNIGADVSGWCVKNTADSDYCRIERCRIFRRTSSVLRPMLNFGGYSFREGMIGSFIMSGNDDLGIRFKNDDSKFSTEIYGCRGVRYL